MEVFQGRVHCLKSLFWLLVIPIVIGQNEQHFDFVLERSHLEHLLENADGFDQVLILEIIMEQLQLQFYFVGLSPFTAVNSLLRSQLANLSLALNVDFCLHSLGLLGCILLLVLLVELSNDEIEVYILIRFLQRRKRLFLLKSRLLGFLLLCLPFMLLLLLRSILGHLSFGEKRLPERLGLIGHFIILGQILDLLFVVKLLCFFCLSWPLAQQGVLEYLLLLVWVPFIHIVLLDHIAGIVDMVEFFVSALLRILANGLDRVLSEVSLPLHTALVWRSGVDLMRHFWRFLPFDERLVAAHGLRVIAGVQVQLLKLEILPQLHFGNALFEENLVDLLVDHFGQVLIVLDLQGLVFGPGLSFLARF